MKNLVWGKNENVNALVLDKPVISMAKVTSHKAVAKQTHTHELSQKPNISHNEEKISLVLFLASSFAV